jgi:lambda repressor-like predicted transcriptional regulator
VDFTKRAKTPQPLTDRLRRSASLERHLPRVERLVADAVALDTRLVGDWWEVLALDWQATGPRSRRGKKAKIDADEIDRLRGEGLSLPEIAERLGVHPKTPGNVLYRARQRQIPALPDD